jgi:L-ribulose-5-phosphate 3-epimerase
MTRRSFLAAAAAAPLMADAKRPTLCMFSKHFPELKYEELGKTCRDLGFGGIDLTVRPKGHVLPEHVGDDLPRAIDALRKAGLEVPMITTELTSASDPAAVPTLKTAARLGIPYFKPGYWRYNAVDPLARIKEVAADIRGIAALAAEHKITMGLHNHSGTYVGEAVWDTWEMIRDLDPRWTGFYYDPGHAAIEGGLGGHDISQRLVTPRLKMAAMKDFYWQKDARGWKSVWCPMGEGAVNWKQVFADFAKAGYAGPLSLHLEYDGGMDVAARIAAVRKDLAYIHNFL